MLRYCYAACLGLALIAPSLSAQSGTDRCKAWRPSELRHNPTEAELRCRYGASGAGRFGLLSYVDVPVYQPDTPMPGTHIAGVQGHARPMPGESFEEWEWRVLRTTYGPSARVTHRELSLLHPEVAARIERFEQRLRKAGVSARRLETWRSRDRQAFLFQQGRSRPGPLATTTLTSWHSQTDALGRPAGRAVDYDVPTSHLARFHAIVREVGLESFGADSNDRGHVFLPGGEALTEDELILLRVLPRVPEVTLATGIPVDKPLPVGGRTSLRAAAAEFARETFLPRPAARLAKASYLETAVRRHAKVPEPPEPCVVRRVGWLRALTGGGDDRCEPRRSGAHASARAGRSKGE